MILHNHASNARNRLWELQSERDYWEGVLLSEGPVVVYPGAVVTEIAAHENQRDRRLNAAFRGYSYSWIASQWIAAEVLVLKVAGASQKNRLRDEASIGLMRL